MSYLMSVKIDLSNTECEYLHAATFLPPRLKKGFSFIKEENNHLQMRISTNEADEIRDLCGEQLQLVGFDEKYQPTPEGKILESLIDKFFIG